MILLRFLCLILLAVNGLRLYAQKPVWIANTPKELNYTYKFIVITSYGANLEEARFDAKDRLADNKQLAEGVRITRNTREHTDIHKFRKSNGPLQSEKTQRISIDMSIDGEKYDLQANKIDEYAQMVNGQVKLYTLFQVATCSDPVFDNVYLTEKYGAVPVLMSLVPGAGQMYKGSYLKGGCILGAEIACVAGIILCENQRADYANKVIEQPRFAKEYNTKANNWATGRNLAIGVAGALYVYNLIDAAVTNGARKVKLKPVGSAEFSCNPCILSDGLNQLSAGVQLSLNF